MNIIESEVRPERIPIKTCSQCGWPMPQGPATKCSACRAPEVKVKSDQVGRPITNRERHVVKLVSEGCSNKEIAARLGLTEGTVKIYVSHIYIKLSIENRVQLALWWIRSQSDTISP